MTGVQTCALPISIDCWHSTNIGRSITGLHEELTNERQMHQSIEMKLKEVENQLQQERNMRRK